MSQKTMTANSSKHSLVLAREPEEIQAEIDRLTERMSRQQDVRVPQFAMFMLTMMTLKWALGEVHTSPVDVVFKED